MTIMAIMTLKFALCSLKSLLRLSRSHVHACALSCIKILLHQDIIARIIHTFTRAHYRDSVPLKRDTIPIMRTRERQLLSFKKQ